ncbi:MAG: insulinase family protein [bacterium]|nr:insulinase family protein [bacterium]
MYRKNYFLLFLVFFSFNFVIYSLLVFSEDLIDYEWSKVLDYKKKEFDKSWNNFLDTNFFAYDLNNSKVYNFSVIFKYGLKDEDVNNVGIRFFLFYLLREIINEKLKNQDIYFKDELIITEDYVGYSYLLLDSSDVKKVYQALNNIYFDDMYNINFDIKKKEIKKEMKEYYESSINPVLFFFKQQVFTAHPYYYLPYGNYNNIDKITISDLKNIDLSKFDKFYILIGSNSKVVYRELFKDYYYKYSKSSFSNDILKLPYYNNLSNFYNNDYSNYRFIDIKKSKVLSFDISSKNSYDIFLFSVPSFYQNYKEYLAMLVIDNLLCDDLVGIFYKELREDQGIIYSLYSFYPTLFLTSYYLVITASDSSSNEFKVFYTIRNILENFENNKDIYTEINEAKNRVINKIYLVFDNPYSLSNSLIYSLLYKDKSISPFYLIDNIYYLDNDYIRQVAKKYLSSFYAFRLIGNNN